MRAKWICGVAALFGAGMLVGQVMAEGHEEKEGAGAGGPPMWMVLTKEHKDNLKWAGDWIVEMEFMMGPGKVLKSTGVAKFEPVMGGRYMKQSFSCAMDGMAYTGMGFHGYDVIAKEHVSIWLDNQSTYMGLSRGTATEMKGIGPSHILGKLAPYKHVFKHTDDNNMTMEFWDTMPDGKLGRTGTLKYSRK
ncbi:MAG: DUF1579 domain-containing protein [Planctomycetota bacterium]|nr:DUF1579 domain-containing protein [Planctomycetota bacterium]